MAAIDRRGSGSRLRGEDLLLLVVANALWGSTDVAAKFALAELSPVAVAWVRFSFAAAAFVPALYFRRSEIPRNWRDWLPLVALGGLGFFLNFLLQYQGLRFAPASHATALRISEALIIVVLSFALLGERISRWAALGLVAGMGGVALVLDLNFSELGLFRSGYRLGDLLILGGLVVESGYTILGKRVLARTSPLAATGLACVFGWLMLTLSSPGEVYQVFSAPPSGWTILACAYLGIPATAFGYLVWYRALAREQSHLVGITIMIQPVVGIPLAALVFGDRLDAKFLGGAALIGLGVFFASRRGHGPVGELTPGEKRG